MMKDLKITFHMMFEVLETFSEYILILDKGTVTNKIRMFRFISTS